MQKNSHRRTFRHIQALDFRRCYCLCIGDTLDFTSFASAKPWISPLFADAEELATAKCPDWEFRRCPACGIGEITILRISPWSILRISPMLVPGHRRDAQNENLADVHDLTSAKLPFWHFADSQSLPTVKFPFWVFRRWSILTNGEMPTLSSFGSFPCPFVLWISTRYWHTFNAEVAGFEKLEPLSKCCGISSFHQTLKGCISSFNLHMVSGQS
jgi:hypothetical protein